MANRMLLVDLLVQLHELVGGENHHSANQGKQKNAGNNTDLQFNRPRKWKPD